jgi:cubilin
MLLTPYRQIIITVIFFTACGGRLTTETGVLTFPSGVFKTYANLISCAWTIETNVTKVLNITFKRFSVEDSHSCRYDWLQVERIFEMNW